MFESALPLDPGHLRQALVALTHHHDALRLRLARGGAGWQLELRAEDEPGLAPLEVIELGERTDADAERALRDAITASYHQVSIVAGPAIRLALIRRTGHRDRLLMSIHHCAFDNYSLGILFDDFRTALGQVMRGASLALPPTVGYREWASYQVASAGSREIEAEASYWLAEKNLRAYPMPTAKPRIPHYFRDMRIERRALDAERTTAMTALSPQYKGVGIHHLLCAAFARAYCAWSGQPALRLDIEHHGRSGTDAPLSLARTVGSLTTKYPLVIPGGGADAMADLDRALTTLLNVPRQGVGYGLLRYCGRDRGIAGQLAAVPPPDVFFNFLGNVTAAMQAEGFRFMPLERYATPDDIISYALMLNGRIEGGQLTLEWIYSAAMQEPAQMAALADGTLAALAQLMATLQRK
jgi:non-ribosomal peptide synthase protein (TIGR01720 family)